MSISAIFCSSLTKVFSDTKNVNSFSKISVLSGEKANFQLILQSDTDTEAEISTDFPGASLYEVKEIYAGYAIDKEDCGDTLL